MAIFFKFYYCEFREYLFLDWEKGFSKSVQKRVMGKGVKKHGFFSVRTLWMAPYVHTTMIKHRHEVIINFAIKYIFGLYIGKKWSGFPSSDLVMRDVYTHSHDTQVFIKKFNRKNQIARLETYFKWNAIIFRRMVRWLLFLISLESQGTWPTQLRRVSFKTNKKI